MEILPESLSDRELAVLRLIAAGASNAEIANTLIIAISTVKRHTGNLYGKLGVNSRTRAIARAQQLGLLSFAVLSLVALP
jgi:LuxR family maltose regulon positive regulatory protein